MRDECVVFEYVLDFEPEKPTSAKSLEIIFLEIKAKLFAALFMVATTKCLCGVLLDMIWHQDQIILFFLGGGLYFLLNFLIFTFAIVKIDYLQG